MSDQATDGSNDSGPSSNQSTDDEATPDYSTNTNELSNDFGGQFSDPRHPYAQRGQADRLGRGDVYEHRGYTERYERPQRDPRQQQRQPSQDLQAVEYRRRLEAQRRLEEQRRLDEQRRLEAQRRLEEQRREQRRQYAARLAARRNAGREQYPPKDPKDDDESQPNRRRKPR